MDASTKKGIEIRNNFKSTFSELEMLRKGVWAVAVLNDKTMSLIDPNHIRSFNDFDVAKAKDYQEELIKFNTWVVTLLGECSAERDLKYNPDANKDPGPPEDYIQ